MSLKIKIAFGLLALASTSFGSETVVASQPPSVAFSVMRVIGALFLVFALLFAGVLVFRNSSRLNAGRGRLNKLKVLESRSLGHRHSIFVVGYENQRLLLSTSPTGVTMLSHLPEATAEETASEGAPDALPNFSTAFVQALTAGRK